MEGYSDHKHITALSGLLENIGIVKNMSDCLFQNCGKDFSKQNEFVPLKQKTL